MPRMKNIYNLISDAFISLNYNELDYSINVIHLENSYKISITSRDQGMAFLYLILNQDHTLLDVYETNTLFLNDIWYRFCNIFEGHIQYSRPIQQIINTLN